MTVSEAIASAKSSKPTTLKEEDLLQKIKQLELLIYQKVYKKAREDENGDPLPEIDNDTELSVGVEHEEIYPAYLRAKIDFDNEDSITYNNSMSMYNSVYTDFAKWYQRTQSAATGIKISNLI